MDESSSSQLAELSISKNQAFNTDSQLLFDGVENSFTSYLKDKW